MSCLPRQIEGTLGSPDLRSLRLTPMQSPSDPHEAPTTFASAGAGELSPGPLVPGVLAQSTAGQEAPEHRLSWKSEVNLGWRSGHWEQVARARGTPGAVALFTQVPTAC